MVQLTWNGCEAFNIGRIRGDIVENIDQDKEDGDKESHATRDDLWRDEEANPGYNHEESRRQIVVDNVFEGVSLENHFVAGERIVSYWLPDEQRIRCLQGFEFDVVIKDSVS